VETQANERIHEIQHPVPVEVAVTDATIAVFNAPNRLTSPIPALAAAKVACASAAAAKYDSSDSSEDLSKLCGGEWQYGNALRRKCTDLTVSSSHSPSFSLHNGDIDGDLANYFWR
jgi:hypothetical protein